MGIYVPNLTHHEARNARRSVQFAKQRKTRTGYYRNQDGQAVEAGATETSLTSLTKSVERFFS